jgi:long-subunit fatty acid transport protein
MRWSLHKSLVVAAASLLLLTVSVQAGDFSRVGSAGAQFLKIGMGARYIGVGEAATAIVDDAYSMYWNPAGMAKMEGSEFAFTNVDWVESVNLNFVSFATPVSFGGTAGFALTVLSVGDMEETTVWQPDGTGRTFDASSFAIAAGYAHSLTDRFAAGFKIKYVSERIAEARSKGYAFDIGTRFDTGYRNLRMGVSVLNLGPGMRFSGSTLDFEYRRDQDNTNYDAVDASLTTEDYDLPLTFRLGLAYDFIQNEFSTWTVSADAKHPNDNVQQLSLGTEYTWKQAVSLRAGYKFRSEEEGLTLGGGVIVNPTSGSALVVDYAWSDFGNLDSAHRFSFGIRF